MEELKKLEENKKPDGTEGEGDGDDSSDGKDDATDGTDKTQGKA